MVTGGCGFIGAQLVELLANNNLEVISIDYKDRMIRTANTIRAVVGDLRDRTLMNEIFSAGELDCIFDLAAVSTIGLKPSEYRRNVDQTHAMVEYILKHNIKKYIYYSSQSAFRKPGCIPFHDFDYAPIDHYGEAKVKSEELIHSSLPRDKFLILRPTYVWGPGHRGFRNGLLYRLLKGHLIISNDPNIKRYYGYIETIAAQTLAFSRRSFADLPRKVYYISDDAISLGEFCSYLALALGRGKAWSAPSSLIKLLGAIGTLNSKLGLPAPINSIQARDLTTNFPVPIEPTLSLTECLTDLTLAAAKTVSWAVRTDERFRSAIETRTTPRPAGPNR
jgi:nucleoside-diphosphate-sugar epimerase